MKAYLIQNSKINFDFIDYVYLLRPYSWIHSFLVGVVAGFYAGQSSLNSLALAGLQGLLGYLLLLLILEVKHRDIGRPLIGKTWTLLVAALMLLIAVQNKYALVCVGLLAVFSYLYSLKKSRPWGEVSFLTRGLTVLAQFFAVYFIFTQIVSLEVLAIAFSIALVVSSRNLIGDLRDIKTDKYTFPVLHGINTSKSIGAILFAGGAVSLFLVGQQIVALVAIALLIAILFIKNAFLLHRSTIVLTTTLLVSMLFSLTPLVIVLIPLDALVNWATYKKIYRPINQAN